jgi:hypothetical protein
LAEGVFAEVGSVVGAVQMWKIDAAFLQSYDKVV